MALSSCLDLSCAPAVERRTSGVKNYEKFARVIVLSLSIVDGFLQRACLRWLVSCFLIPWTRGPANIVHDADRRLACEALHAVVNQILCLLVKT